MTLTLPTPIDALAFHEHQGLLPTIVQDAHDHRVLMLAYVNRNALKRTVETGDAWYWSRSRNSLWRKGETSGNTQHVVRIETDCDGDAIIYRVEQRGAGACHRATRSCFD